MRVVLILLALSGLAGCSTLQPAPSAMPAGLAQVVSPERFEMRGRVSVRTPEQQFSGGMAWRRAGPEEVVLLTSPLGQGVAELHMGPGGAILTDAEGRRHEAPDAEALLAAVQGWRLPLQGLGYWITGRPDPARPHGGERDATGRWTRLEQDDWRIEFARHGENGLPGRLVARRGEVLEIRLVVDSWQAP